MVGVAEVALDRVRKPREIGNGQAKIQAEGLVGPSDLGLDERRETGNERQEEEDEHGDGEQRGNRHDQPAGRCRSPRASEAGGTGSTGVFALTRGNLLGGV